MSLSKTYIIALQQIKDFGAKTVKTIVDLSMRNRIDSESEFCDFINYLISNGRLRGVKSELDLYEIQDAVSQAEQIVEDSYSKGIGFLSYLDSDYPKYLLNTIREDGKPDIPIILYYKGDLGITQKKAIAIIGTRQPTKEGVMDGEFYGELFAEAGYNIVSGLALGCDTAAHRGALRSTGATTAFMATGIDNIYPPENKDLARHIVEKGGLLMTEYPLGTRCNRFNLVARDRLQAALADATLVIQTDVRGGTMHAAIATLKLKKPLFCTSYPTLEGEGIIEGNALLVSRGAQYINCKNALDVVNAAIAEK